MSQTYQNKRRPARHVAENMAVPQSVSVAMDQIATSMRDGLLALAVQSGLAVMFAILDEDVTAICGPRGRHNPGRTAVLHGSDAGSVVLGGRRPPIRRPRVRTADGTGEVAIPSYELFSFTEILEKCSANCPPAATGSAWSPSAAASSKPPPAPQNRRSRGGSSPPPNAHSRT